MSCLDRKPNIEPRGEDIQRINRIHWQIELLCEYPDTNFVYSERTAVFKYLVDGWSSSGFWGFRWCPLYFQHTTLTTSSQSLNSVLKYPVHHSLDLDPFTALDFPQLRTFWIWFETGNPQVKIKTYRDYWGSENDPRDEKTTLMMSWGE